MDDEPRKAGPLSRQIELLERYGHMGLMEMADALDVALTALKAIADKNNGPEVPAFIRTICESAVKHTGQYPSEDPDWRKGRTESGGDI